jgi:hypothetical protein
LFVGTCAKHYTLQQIDIKSALLNRFLQEKTYVEQPKGFINQEFPVQVFRLKKTLY